MGKQTAKGDGRFDLEVTDTATHARVGAFHTDHGTIPTPVFMPVGTLGTVKGISHRDLRQEIGARVILGNTYHLFLRPGMEVLEEAGGLHAFSGWERPLLTDSGGYQVYSLAAERKIREEGVEFRSHIDGSRQFFDPENVMDIQRGIGADIIMAFDECTPYPCEKEYARDSMALTHRWLDRCIERFSATEPRYGHRQSLFPIVQGSVYPDLRRKSAEEVAARECEGNAIGGLSVGEPAEMMYEMAGLVCNILPEDRPRYLMGVGTPANLLECIALGVDMFDCVMPTRNARNGMLFTRQGVINIRNRKWKRDFGPIDPLGTTFADRQYSKAYLRHLMTAHEMLGAQLATLHNLGFYADLVAEARARIIDGSFGSWKHEMVKQVSQRL